MKTYVKIIVVSATLCILVPTTTVFAVDASPTPSSSPKPQLIRKQEIKEAREEFKDEVKTANQQFRSEKAKQHADRLERRFAYYAKRFNTIATRIQTLIDKKKAAGKDITKAQAQLDASKVTLNQAIADGKKAVDMFRSITVATWDVQKPEVKAAIDQAQKARKEFVEAQTELLKTVSTIKNV